TLFYLNLRKKHACSIVEDTQVVRGMLNKIQDYVTFGEVSDEVLKQLAAKRRKDEKKEVYFLAPPVGGFERKGIKKSYVVGGALGDRKEAINELLTKMM
ncbi:uL30 family ribosomal protein, partial [Candidatus Woesearchaeota archaeon]|nr:uL30 family ribosomal protein [Candidatus Woesearchaeota archaeon]